MTAEERQALEIEWTEIGERLNHIGTGNPDWGAEPGKQYFVIRLGERMS